jgi:Transcription factor WhiB
VIDWRLQAACRTADPDLFFTAAEGVRDRARRVCAGCWVQLECFTLAMTVEADLGETPESNLKQRHGMYAGLTGYQRWTLVYPLLAADRNARNQARMQRRRSDMPAMP